MTQLRQKFLNLKTKLQTSFLWTVFKKGALILLLLFLRVKNWKISWEDIRKIPQKICNFVKKQLEESESLAKEYKPIGSLITNVKNAWEKFYTLIKSTNWKEIKKNININGLSNLLDNTSRAIANTIYKTIGNLNPVNWFNEDTEKEDAKMHAELMSTGDEGEMEQNILDKTITTMDELAYRQHGVALLQNKELAWVLKSVGNFIDKTIDTASVERANGNDKS